MPEWLINVLPILAYLALMGVFIAVWLYWLFEPPAAKKGGDDKHESEFWEDPF